MNKEFIPVFKPFLTNKEEEASKNVLNTGWLGMGKNVGDFEACMHTYLGLKDKYVVAVSTGHAALHLALLLMGIGKGDEVITPAFNNIADFQAILATGAEPVFCDIEEETLNINPIKIEELITEKTKAIIIMDYDCILCDYDKINAIANKYNIRVLHDAAHSFGSSLNNKKIGSFSDITMFSFDPVKTITCIDGGLLVVNTKEEVEKLHEMRLIGMSQSANIMYTNSRAWSYDVNNIGFRYHMSNMHAAIGLAQMSKIDIITNSRREACKYYNKKLNSNIHVTTPQTDFKDIVPFLYYIRVSSKYRDELRDYLYKNNIDTGVHWQPGHQFSLFKDSRKGDLKITEKIANEIISLPLHSDMNLILIDRITENINKFFLDSNSKLTGNFIFQNKDQNKLELIGDFEGLYQNIEDPWEQSSDSSTLIPYYNFCRGRLINSIKKTTSNQHILEIGSGLGDVTNLIQKEINPKVLVGVDISKTAVTKAKIKYNNIHFIEGDIVTSNFGYSNTFDIVILNQMLWFVIHDFQKVLNNIFKILKDKGTLIITMGFPHEQKYAKDIINGHNGLIEYCKKINNFQLTYNENDTSNTYDYKNSIVCLQKDI